MPRRRTVRTIPERIREIERRLTRISNCCPEGFKFIVLEDGLYVENITSGVQTKVGS